MTDRELMQQALDALEYLATQTRPVYSAEKAIEALRARLDEWERVNMHDHKEGDLSIGTKPYAAQAAMVAQQTQGRMYVDPVTGDVGIGTVEWDASAPLVVHPHPAFQATQPQREWIGLTDEEIQQIQISVSSKLSAIYISEAQLKGKNA
jgi:hypothetical protein